MLDRLDTELNAEGIHMAFVELRTRLHDLVYRYGLFETLDRDHFYSSIDDALLAIESEEAGESTSPGARDEGRAAASAGPGRHRAAVRIGLERGTVDRADRAPRRAAGAERADRGRRS